MDKIILNFKYWRVIGKASRMALVRLFFGQTAKKKMVLRWRTTLRCLLRSASRDLFIYRQHKNCKRTQKYITFKVTSPVCIQWVTQSANVKLWCNTIHTDNVKQIILYSYTSAVHLLKANFAIGNEDAFSLCWLRGNRDLFLMIT